VQPCGELDQGTDYTENQPPLKKPNMSIGLREKGTAGSRDEAEDGQHNPLHSMKDFCQMIHGNDTAMTPDEISKL